MMKRRMLSLVTLFLMGTLAVFAGNKTEKFKVYGNCGMCEKRIEKAALSVDGVLKADWNKDTKMMEVTLNDGKTDVQKVQKAIAKIGHDTNMFKATDEAYNDLPGCCQYDRSKEDAKKEIIEISNRHLLSIREKVFFFTRKFRGRGNQSGKEWHRGQFPK